MQIKETLELLRGNPSVSAKLDEYPAHTITWIATLSVQHNLPLATNDAHFRHFGGLVILPFS